MTKNWALAKKCLHRLCYDLNLTGLLLGRWQILDLPFRRNLVIRGDVPRGQLLDYLHLSRFVFVPSVLDASPRLLAQALCMNVPILVHRHILGGWKYVSASTGSFFDSEDDIAEAAKKCLEYHLKPRQWFQMHYGPIQASTKLSAFLARLGGAVEPMRSLQLTRQVLIP
jgi:glycosyltransferase involved in cell wall biosynthesis